MQRMTKQQMEVCTKPQLIAIAKELGIVGRHDMAKQKLVEEICKVNSTQEQAPSIKDDAKCESDGASKDIQQTRAWFIENAAVGTIVAFRMSDGRVKSAKIIKKSRERRQFMLETEYGAKFVVNYHDIVWVRNGRVWPRTVWEMLKGVGVTK